jgi:hypothetical protein
MSPPVVHDRLRVFPPPPEDRRSVRPDRGAGHPSDPLRRPSARATCRLSVGVAALVIAAIAASACAIRLLAAGLVGGWLNYRFSGVPARPHEAVAIFVHNGRALAGVFGLLLIAQTALRGGAQPGLVQHAVRNAAEAVIAGLIAANVLLVGAGLGAYGGRMARAMLPHGPVELAAFALALAVYLQGRCRALLAWYVVTAGATSVLLLAGAAVLETYVTV